MFHNKKHYTVATQVARRKIFYFSVAILLQIIPVKTFKSLFAPWMPQST